MKWTLQRAAVVAAVFAIAGCPGDDSAGDSGTESGTTEATPASTTMTTGMTAPTPDPSSSGDPTDTTGGTTTTNGTTASTDPTSGSGSSGGSSSGGEVAIPDPGGETDSWQSAGDISTPGAAWQVGVATIASPYVEGTAAEDGNAFFVFEAGPALDAIQIRVFGGQDADDIHLHDGTGLVFGDEIAPDEEEVNRAVFTTTPGNIYVLEIIFPGAGFF